MSLRSIIGTLFKRRSDRPNWTVAVSDDEIITTDGTGVERRVPKADLSAIVVQTDDSGPWGEDFIWYLVGANGPLTGFPLGTLGEQEFLAFAQGLPGYDEREFGRAVASTNVASFTIWQRS